VGSAGTGVGSLIGVGGAGGRAFGSVLPAGGGVVGFATGGFFGPHAAMVASASTSAAAIPVFFISLPSMYSYP
jgi:hypothetical protein